MGQKWAGLVISREASQDKDIDQQFVAEHLKQTRPSKMEIYHCDHLIIIDHGHMERFDQME